MALELKTREWYIKELVKMIAILKSSEKFEQDLKETDIFPSYMEEKLTRIYLGQGIVVHPGLIPFVAPELLRFAGETFSSFDANEQPGDRSYDVHFLRFFPAYKAYLLDLVKKGLIPETPELMNLRLGHGCLVCGNDQLDLIDQYRKKKRSFLFCYTCNTAQKLPGHRTRNTRHR